MSISFSRSGRLSLWLVMAAACTTSAQPQKLQGPTDVVAVVAGTSVTLGEVDQRALREPASRFGGALLSTALYEARRLAIDEIVADRLLDREAKARGVDRAALVAREITAKATKPSEADITGWYQANTSRLRGAALDTVHDDIAALLLDQRVSTARQEYVAKLRTASPVTMSLEPPRAHVQEAGRPAQGPAGAPVHIVEFSDFQCPFCLRALPTVRKVLSTYGDKIRLVYRHYPLENHVHARPAAEAAACAADQGKFWEYHDRLFAEQAKLTAEDLKQHASAVGVDRTKFDSCVDTHKFSHDVEADIAAGAAAGVDGTPAFFINGRLLSGAQPFEVFKQVIDEELAH